MAWTTSGQVISPNSFHDFAAGTFVDGNYEWQVRTYDAQGVPGPWSSSGFFTTSTPPPGPTITAPTNGSTVGLSSVDVTWSYPSQDAYQLQVLDENGAVLTDTGQVNETTTRSYTVNLPDNNVNRTAQVRELDGGLWSAWAAVTFTVSYTPPATPVVTMMDDPTHGTLVVGISNPAPAAGEPDVSYNDVLIDDGDGKGYDYRAGSRMLPTNRSWTYWTPVSGRDYSTAIRVAAVGTNGTVAYAETATPAPVYEDIDGGTATQVGTQYLDGGGI